MTTDDMRRDCPIRHPENGNCTCIGGFCTAVSDEICAGLRNAFDSGTMKQREKTAHLKIAEFSMVRAKGFPEEEMVALFDERVIDEEDVLDKLELLSSMDYDSRVALLTKEQFINIFRGGDAAEGME